VDDLSPPIRTHWPGGWPQTRDGAAPGGGRWGCAVAQDDLALRTGDLLAFQQSLDDVRVDHRVFAFDANTDRSELEQQVLFRHVHPLGQILEPDFCHGFLGSP